jgi:hypothetical protein
LSAFNGWSFPRDFPLFLRYGPHFLLAPLAVLAAIAGRRLPSFLRFLLWPLLPLALASAPSHEAWRYLLAGLPALALLLAWLCAQALRKKGGIQTTAVASLVFALSPALALSPGNALFYDLGVKPAAGGDRRSYYLGRATPYYAFYEKAESVLKPGDKVLLLREVRGYHLDADYEWFEPLVQYDLEELPQGDDVLAFLRERGFTRAVLHDEPGWFNSFTPWGAAGERAQAAIAGRGRLLLREGAYSLYALD